MRAVWISLSCLCLYGCTVDGVDDQAVFPCNPAHELPGGGNADCGEGFTCYGAAASLGFAFCVRQCNAGSCGAGFLCSGEGGCLKSCDPSEDDAGCPMGLHCVTMKGTVGTNAGVCLPVAAACRSDHECTSAVYNYCFTNALLQNTPPDAGVPVSVCLQGGCEADQAACAPGATCLRRVLPSVVNTPDICSPDCDNSEECPPSMICMAKGFPASSGRFCIPGFYNFPCANDLSCFTAGSECAPALNEPPGLQPTVCAVSCATSADCASLPVSGNPTPMTVNACRNGHCVSFDSQRTTLFCLHANTTCAAGGVCTAPQAQSQGNPDGGAQACAVNGGTSGPPPLCFIPCPNGDGDCAASQQALGRPLTCVDGPSLAMLPFTPDEARGFPAKLCIPTVPGLPCDPAKNGADGENPGCLHGLTCLDMKVGPPICSKRCTGDGDCREDDHKTFTLGPGFACAPLGTDGPLCVPRTPAGRPPMLGMPSLCMTPDLVRNGLCASPNGTGCDADDECQSGRCDNAGCTQQGVCAAP